jgi:hypothetical protein
MMALAVRFRKKAKITGLWLLQGLDKGFPGT